MADYITKIRTINGDKQIDYNALANLPDIGNLVKVDDTLTQTGFAADAKATGDAINQVQTNIDEVSVVVENLDTKYYTESEIDSKLGVMQADIDSKSGTDHIHDDTYYTETEIDSMIAEMNAYVDGKFADIPDQTEIDISLTQEGQAADAKAVGDALAQKSQVQIITWEADD